MPKTFLLYIVLFLIVVGWMNPGVFRASEASVDELDDAYTLEWIWGEVVSLGDASVTINYLDYDDDTEKQKVIQVNEETVYENVDSLEDINAGDTLSIDYVADKQGDAVGRQISREVFEDSDEDDDSLPGTLLESESDDAAVMSVPVE